MLLSPQLRKLLQRSIACLLWSAVDRWKAEVLCTVRAEQCAELLFMKQKGGIQTVVVGIQHNHRAVTCSALKIWANYSAQSTRLDGIYERMARRSEALHMAR